MSRTPSFTASHAAAPQPIDRPPGVVAVAAFQIFKSAILLLAGVLLACKPELVVDPQSALHPLLSVATRGNFTAFHRAVHDPNLLSGLMFFLAIYLALIASALWNLSQPARRSLLFTSGFTLLLALKSALLPSTPGAAGLPSPNLQTFNILLFLDAVVFVYLLKGTTFEAFKTRT